MTKEDFLNNPLYCQQEVPLEWIAEAWATDAGSYRRITIEQLARDVSKNGMLAPNGKRAIRC